VHENDRSHRHLLDLKIERYDDGATDKWCLTNTPRELVARHAEGSARVLVFHQRKILGCAKLNNHFRLSTFKMTGARKSGDLQNCNMIGSILYRVWCLRQCWELETHGSQAYF
jgi:hypothetical protein